MKTLAFVFLLAASPALAQQPKAQQPKAQPQKKIHYTYWQPPKLRPDDPMRVHPGLNVVQNHEQFTWQIKKGGAKVVGFDALGRGAAIGNMPEGTEVKLAQFRQTNGNIYYGVPFTNAKGEAVTGWVNGHLIVVKAMNTAPAKDSKALTP